MPIKVKVKVFCVCVCVCVCSTVKRKENKTGVEQQEGDDFGG